MENDVALEQAENLKMRAQLLTLLTNDSQRGQGVHELLAGAGLQFHTYYIMALQQTEERYFSQAVLNRVEAVLARRRMRTVTLLLYDLAVIFVPRGDDGKGWHEEATELAYDLFDELVNPVRIGVSGWGRAATPSVRPICRPGAPCGRRPCARETTPAFSTRIRATAQWGRSISPTPSGRSMS